MHSWPYYCLEYIISRPHYMYTRACLLNDDLWRSSWLNDMIEKIEPEDLRNVIMLVSFFLTYCEEI